MDKIKTSIGQAIRVGSKTLVEIQLQPFNKEFDAGTGHFRIIVGDKVIDCYAQPGVIDNLEKGKEVRIPKRFVTPK